MSKDRAGWSGKDVFACSCLLACLIRVPLMVYVASLLLLSGCFLPPRRSLARPATSPCLL